ncbi:hypothetical protein [Halorubrum sp. N11]|uniref:hypothetical protein n=1 Tax=Halorubrum sp. N11 TaxID=3402276 RepID=UPI003EB87E9A
MIDHHSLSDSEPAGRDDTTDTVVKTGTTLVDATTKAPTRADTWDATIQTVGAVGNHVADAVDDPTTSSRQEPVLSLAANKTAPQLGEIYAASKEPGLDTWFLEAKRLERCPSKSGAFESGRQNICPRRIPSDPAMTTTHPPTIGVAQPAVTAVSPSLTTAAASNWGAHQ